MFLVLRKRALYVYVLSNFCRLAEGQPAAYLPIYHYAFTNYSQPLAQLILDKGIELFGKSDARFMEAVYKVSIFLFTSNY
jgi:hypothetical protein